VAAWLATRKLSRSNSRSVANRLPILARLGYQRDRGRETGFLENGPTVPPSAAQWKRGPRQVGAPVHTLRRHAQA